MATLKEWLDEEGFNWEVGHIIYQPKDNYSSPGWGNSVGAEWITMEHPILIKEFDSGFGGLSARVSSQRTTKLFTFLLNTMGLLRWRRYGKT